MRSLRELMEKIAPYQSAEYIYDSEIGFLSWHLSTGGNIEALFIEAAAPRKGYGTELYRRMAKRLIRNQREPYHSIFAFRLASNTAAEKFYDALGWSQQLISPPVNWPRESSRTPVQQSPITIYKGDATVIMWIAWEDFCARLGV